MENPAVLVPEFLVFFSGSLATLIFWALYFSLGKKSLKHIEILRENLRKIDQAWSTNNGEVVPFAQFNAEKERKKTLYTYGILVAVMGFLSWAGLLFSIILALSMKLLPTRFEKRVFASELARDPQLSADQVLVVLRSLSN